MLHTVAKLHYEAEMSQVDIARRLGVSTAVSYTHLTLPTIYSV